MMIITGSVRARADTFEQVRTLSLDHVHRSRLEPGCQLHSVHQDVEDPLRLVFIEHWRDEDAVRAHFAVPASAAFVTEVAALLSDPPSIEIYAAEPVRI